MGVRVSLGMLVGMICVYSLVLGTGVLLLPPPPPSTPPPPPPSPPRKQTLTTTRFEFSVPTGTLELDGHQLHDARGALEDLLCLNPTIEGYLASMDACGARCTLRRGELAISWTGPIEKRDEVANLAQRMHEALLLSVASRPEVATLLDSAHVADRRWLARLAGYSQGPARARVMRALMRDPDADLAWQITSAHGNAGDWLEFALSEQRPPPLRGLALSYLAQGSAEQRCEVVRRLCDTPLLHAAACELLGGLEGNRVEELWLELMRRSDDPDVLERIVDRLGKIGTSRSLPDLIALRERTGFFRFSLRDRVSSVLQQIRDRTGATPGALSLAGPRPEGALSLPRREER